MFTMIFLVIIKAMDINQLIEKYLPDIFCLRYRLFKKTHTISTKAITTNIKLAIIHYDNEKFSERKFRKFQKKLNKQTLKNFAVFRQNEQIPANFTHICFVKQGDSLPTHALNELTTAIENNPDKKIFYSDSEYINCLNQPYKYHLKPMLDKYMLYSFDYISTGLLCIKNVPDFNMDEINSKSIYQLLLNQSEYPELFHRIAKVLYSKRTKAQTNTYPNLVKAHLKKIGFAAQVNSKNGYNKIEFTPIDEPKVSIIIPFKDKVEFLEMVTKSIENTTTYKNYEIILVNNRSEKKETLEFLRKTKHKAIEADFDFNYSKVCNFGASQASGDYLIFMNNDMEIIDKRWIENTLSIAQREEIGVVGTKLIFENNTIQHAGAMATDRKVYNLFSKMHKDGKSYFNYHNILRETQALIGAFHMISKEKFDKVGGYDENYIIEYSDSELSFKLKKEGYKSIYVPNASIYHYEGTSRKGKWKQEIDQDRELFMKNYGDMIKEYNCYNPNLSTYRRQFFHSKLK